MTYISHAVNFFSLYCKLICLNFVPYSLEVLGQAQAVLIQISCSRVLNLISLHCLPFVHQLLDTLISIAKWA